MLERLKEILWENADIEKTEVTQETDFRNDLALDSFDLAQLIYAVEEEFDVEISGKEISEIRTMGDLVNFLESKEA